MKQLLYATVTALILSIILTLLVPRWLFKGDARWTYRNDAARVDVKFNGHLKNGHVGVEGADLRVTQPAWLSNGSSQGTMIEIPVSYRNKMCRVKLTPKADELGEDASLIIELKGRDFQHRGKRRPAWVSFRNITLNGQSVAKEKEVWHNKPFVLEYPLHSSPECTLTFDVCKPLTASDISFVNPIALFFACLLLSLFSTPLKRVADHILSFINRRDIVKMVSDGYLHIDPVYRRSFWIIFGVLCFAFGFHTICFMWGNHDWRLLNRFNPWLDHAGEGRYMLFSVKASLLKGVYLPLIHDVTTFVALALNAVLLCRYWCLHRRVIYYVLCGLVLTVQPFTLSMLYFVNMTPEVFIGVTCVLVSLLLSEKVVVLGGSVARKILYSFIVIVLINFALAMYPVLLNTIAVAFGGKLSLQAFDWDGSRRQLKSHIRLFIISVAHILSGILLYKLIVSFIFPTRNLYNTDTLGIEQVPARLGILLRQCFHQLYEYNMPFLSQWTLWVFLGLTILLTLHICFTGNFKQKIVRLFLLFGSLFATQVTMIIAKAHLIDGRVELFGLVFFEVLVMVLSITCFQRLHNLWIILGSCIVITSVINDLDALRVWKLGFDAEKMLWNRMLSRLEIQKGFDPTKKYDIVHVGVPITMRPRFYTRLRKFTYGCGHFMLYAPYEIEVIPFEACEFYYPTHFRGKFFSTAMARKPSHRPGYESRLKRLYQAGVLQKAAVWPKENGLIVWKNIILYVTDGEELDNYRKKFERELGEK